MRTKVLLLSAVLAALGAASAVAQVYSVNAVGYVNVTIPAGSFAMITNPLDAGTGNNTVGNLIPAPPDGTTVYKYINGMYEAANSFGFGSWQNAAQTILPGEGVFIKTPAGQSLTITFVGEVQQGVASNKSLVAGFNMTGSLVPQAGLLQTDLEYVPGEGDIVYKYNVTTQVYDPAYIFGFGVWNTQPSLAVGEAVFIKAAAARTWTRDFSVN
jgi:hypothetical protein